MSKPSKMPAAAPGPPDASPEIPVGRLPFRNMSMQLETNFVRDAAVAATSEKYFEYVQPPSEMTIRSFGYFAFSSRSWFIVPLSGADHESAEPSTEMAEVYAFW